MKEVKLEDLVEELQIATSNILGYIYEFEGEEFDRFKELIYKIYHRIFENV